jgi:hypothetical protein
MADEAEAAASEGEVSTMSSLSQLRDSRVTPCDSR